MPARFGLLVFIITACGPRTERDATEDLPVQLARVDGGCAIDSVRPATGAPAEGLWGYEDPARSHRVAAMIGPARSVVGATRVTRTVETLETASDRDTIRHSSDTVAVHLEFIPPFERPAAVYPVGPRLLLVSYEPCVPDPREPLIRYLREDTQGRVVTDVLLRRAARP